MTNAHILDSLLVGVEPVSDNLPYHYALFQNCPNPFNPTTTIKYSIAKAGRVKIRIYDILGREVETVVNKQMPVGEYEVRFDAAHLSSGLYFYKISSGEFTKTKKMLLLK
ncbi:MAG: T9SS type A sorting domain-containing protein [candidate division Zixibacteria bacterium]|nr:T9SS type A sorting domain-containing protein [Gammaproteobacteria bacterium]NIX57454.1 T9SS type A sorting domain-containing protein [candidate division Zixibacteria bacterium]